MLSMFFCFSFVFSGTFECQNLINNTFRFHRWLSKPANITLLAKGSRGKKCQSSKPNLEISSRLVFKIIFHSWFPSLPWELRLETWPKREKIGQRMYPAHVGPFIPKYYSAQHYAGLARCWPLAKINAKREKWPLEMLTNNLFTSE